MALNPSYEGFDQYEPKTFIFNIQYEIGFAAYEATTNHFFYLPT